MILSTHIVEDVEELCTRLAIIDRGVQVDMTIGTVTDQTAVSTGALRRRWTEQGRRYFRYVSEELIGFAAPVFSGRYALVEDRWNDVALQLFHHPDHTRGVEPMMRSMKASLDYYTKNLGPYRYSQLRTYIMYHNGAIALLTLRDFLGEDAVNGALRRYLEKYRDSGPPCSTALDQYAELKAITPDSLSYLLTDLFETVTLWDVKAERATVRKTASDAWQVSLDIIARKMRADSVGTETGVLMDDLVEIGVFAPGAQGAPLYVQRHRIRGGRQTVRITVRQAPGRAGVDPYHKLLDREREDNVVAVTAAGRKETNR